MEGGVRLLGVMEFILQIKVQLAKDQCNHNFSHVFCEGFAQTDPFSSRERAKTHRMSLGARRGLEELASGIKSFWNEF